MYRKDSALDSFKAARESLKNLTPAEVDIGGREVLQALVVSAVIVVLDEVANVGFEIAGQVVVFQQDAVLQGLMLTLDFALGLRTSVIADQESEGLKVGAPRHAERKCSISRRAKATNPGTSKLRRAPPRRPI